MYTAHLQILCSHTSHDKHISNYCIIVRRNNIATGMQTHHQKYSIKQGSESQEGRNPQFYEYAPLICPAMFKKSLNLILASFVYKISNVSFCKAETHVNWSNHTLQDRNWDFCHQYQYESNQIRDSKSLYSKDTTQMKIPWPYANCGRLLKH